MNFLIRNDDVAYDLDLSFFREFCSLVDKYPGVKMLHAITPLGTIQNIEANWTNEKIIRDTGDVTLAQNQPLLAYLWERQRLGDLMGIHGLRHTHAPDMLDVLHAKKMLLEWEIAPTYYVPPFNEGTYDHDLLKKAGLTLLQFCPRLEEHHDLTPTAKKMLLETGANAAYLHAWRYMPGKFFSLKDLDRCLGRLTA